MEFIAHSQRNTKRVSFFDKKDMRSKVKKVSCSAKKAAQLDLRRENPILSRPVSRELGGKHNWKENNPKHVSLSSDEKVLEDYYSRSIIQFRVKRNDRGSRKRTSPEIRTRKRTKGDFPPTSPSPFPLPFCPYVSSRLECILRVRLRRRNFIQSTTHDDVQRRK